VSPHAIRLSCVKSSLFLIIVWKFQILPTQYKQEFNARLSKSTGFFCNKRSTPLKAYPIFTTH